MYIRRIISIILISAMLAVTVVSCSYGSEGKKVNEASNIGAKGNTASDDSSTPEISIYYMINVNYIGNAIMEYKSKFPDVKVNRKLFYVNSQDDFNKALSTEILTGGGPDVIVCKPLRDLDSVSKIFSNGAFEDLNEFISSDKDFKLSDYNSVINAGVINGRREFVPLYYSLNVLHTTETILQQNSINISENCSISELSDIVKSFMKNEKRKSKYLFDSNFSFYYLLNCCQDRFLDYENKKCNFNNDEFRELLRQYKEMQPAIAPANTDDTILDNATNLLKRNIVALRTDRYGSLYELSGDNCFTGYDFKEDMKIIQITDPANTSKARPAITDIAAVNSNCRNKKYAFEFIKVLLSERIQRTCYSDNNFNSKYNPVNNSAFTKDMEIRSVLIESMSNYHWGYKESASAPLIPIDNVPFSDKIVKRINNIQENTSKPVLIDKSVKLIIDGALSDYLAGKLNEDQAAKLINNKVELFLNE